jgi:hypothetical protein
VNFHLQELLKLTLDILLKIKQLQLLVEEHLRLPQPLQPPVPNLLPLLPLQPPVLNLLLHQPPVLNLLPLQPPLLNLLLHQPPLQSLPPLPNLLRQPERNRR